MLHDFRDFLVQVPMIRREIMLEQSADRIATAREHKEKKS